MERRIEISLEKRNDGYGSNWEMLYKKKEEKRSREMTLVGSFLSSRTKIRNIMGPENLREIKGINSHSFFLGMVPLKY